MPEVLETTSDLINRYKPEIKEEPKVEVVNNDVVIPEVIAENKDVISVENAENKVDGVVEGTDGIKSESTAEQRAAAKAWIFEEEQAKPENKIIEVDPKYKEYDQLFENPLIKAASDYVKAGGKDVSEFVSQLGIQDVSRVTPQDFFTQEAKELGLNPEEIELAVAEKMESFESLGVLDRAKILKGYKEKFIATQTEKLKNFSGVKSEESARFEALQKTAQKNLEEKVNKLKGTKYKGLVPIEDSKVEQIMREAAFYATEINDDRGQVVGYDLDKGINIALSQHLGKRADKEIYNAGYAEGMIAALNDRNRPSDESQPAVNIPSKPDAMEALMKKVRMQNGD